MTDKLHETIPTGPQLSRSGGKDGHIDTADVYTGQCILADLPVKLLENICGHVVAADPHPDATAMSALRLTCRAVHEKTDRIFCKLAFRRVTFYSSYSSVQRLLALSRVPRLAVEVQTLVVWDQGENIAFRWDDIHERLRGPATSQSQTRLLESSERDRNERFFHQNARLDAVVLSQALTALQNIQEIEVCPPFSISEAGAAKHDTLKTLELANRNIIDSTAAEALTRCAEHVNNLQSVRVKQISQGARRTLFRTLGKVKFYVNFSKQESDGEEGDEEGAEEGTGEESAGGEESGGGKLSGGAEWDNDCVVVYLPQRHKARAEAWEGVAGKMRSLAEDLLVTNRQMAWRIDHERFEWHDKEDWEFG